MDRPRHRRAFPEPDCEARSRREEESACTLSITGCRRSLGTNRTRKKFLDAQGEKMAFGALNSQQIRCVRAIHAIRVMCCFAALVSAQVSAEISKAVIHSKDELRLL